MKATKQEKQQVLLIQKSGGEELRVTLPEGARVTFGPTIPYKRGHTANYESSGYSLRVYADNAQKKLLAVFCDVRSFRDISLPCAKLVLREAGNAVWKSDEDGYKVEQQVNRQRHFQELNLLEPGK